MRVYGEDAGRYIKDHAAMEKLRADAEGNLSKVLILERQSRYYKPKAQWTYNQAGGTYADPADAILAEGKEPSDDE